MYSCNGEAEFLATIIFMNFMNVGNSLCKMKLYAAELIKTDSKTVLQLKK